MSGEPRPSMLDEVCERIATGHKVETIAESLDREPIEVRILVDHLVQVGRLRRVATRSGWSLSRGPIQ